MLDESSLSKILPLNELNLSPNPNPKILFYFWYSHRREYENLTQIHLLVGVLAKICLEAICRLEWEESEDGFWRRKTWL